MKIDLDELDRKAKPKAQFRMWWDRIVDAPSPVETIALITRIRELEAAADRAVTIADEAFGLGPVEPIENTLSRIERGISNQHQRNAALERVVTAARTRRDTECTCGAELGCFPDCAREIAEKAVLAALAVLP